MINLVSPAKRKGLIFMFHAWIDPLHSPAAPFAAWSSITHKGGHEVVFLSRLFKKTTVSGARNTRWLNSQPFK
jgi:hypothetical protein